MTLLLLPTNCIYNKGVRTESLVATAKVFKSGNSQAVRLPKDFRLDVEEVEVTRQGGSLVLTPSPKPYGIRLLELMEDLGELVELPEDLPPQEREPL